MPKAAQKKRETRPPITFCLGLASPSPYRRGERYIRRYIFKDTTICVSITLLKYKLSFRISKNPRNKFVYFLGFCGFRRRKQGKPLTSILLGPCVLGLRGRRLRQVQNTGQDFGG